MTPELVFPKPLRRGDKVAIVSPASIIDPTLVEGACNTLTAWGFKPIVAPHALNAAGSYAGSADERLADLEWALTEPEIRTVLCSRGGYGVVHLLHDLDKLDLRADPKWVIGFSDISALHAMMQKQGVASIHGSMARQLSAGPDDYLNTQMLRLLTGHAPYPISWDCGKGDGLTVTAPMVGGNLAVLADLIATPYDILRPNTILVIEDIAEPIYKVERIMYQLLLSGRLENLAALVVGQFTEYKPDANHKSMEAMLSQFRGKIGVPMVMNAPIGHIDGNRPWIEGALTTLSVTPDGTATLTQHLPE